MTYVDGFVLVVPRNRVAEYHKLAHYPERLRMKHGALEFKECMLDNAKPKFVRFTFSKRLQAKFGIFVFYAVDAIISSRRFFLIMRCAISRALLKHGSARNPEPTQSPAT